MSDLTDFLLARIDEDEARADQIHDRNCSSLAPPGVQRPCDCEEPARHRARCEADRLLIGRVESLAAYVDATREDQVHTYDRTVLTVLGPLAEPYRGHEEFQAGWRP